MKTKFLVSNGTYNSGAVVNAIENDQLSDILWSLEASAASKNSILRKLSQFNIVHGNNVVYYTNLIDKCWVMLDKMMRKMVNMHILNPNVPLMNVLCGADTIGIYLCLSADTKDKFLLAKLRLEEGSVYDSNRRLLYETSTAVLLSRNELEKNNIGSDVLWLLKAYEVIG